jgi:hypothetical protein
MLSLLSGNPLCQFRRLKCNLVLGNRPCWLLTDEIRLVIFLGFKVLRDREESLACVPIVYCWILNPKTIFFEIINKLSFGLSLIHFCLLLDTVFDIYGTIGKDSTIIIFTDLFSNHFNKFFLLLQR